MNNANKGTWTVRDGADIYGEYATRASAARAAKRDGGVVEFIPAVTVTKSGAAPWS